MKFDKDIVVGLKIYLGKVDLRGTSINEFIEEFKFKFVAEDDDDENIKSNILINGENKMQARYYDDFTGYIYLTFDQEMFIDDVPFFEDEDLIFKKIEE